MKKVVSVSQSRMLEQMLIEKENSGIMLMGKAAQGVYDAVSFSGKVAIVCGTGNNGGDGYALAKLLYQHGIVCKIFQLGVPQTEDSCFYCEQCFQLGIPCELISDQMSLVGYDMVVDCIFGIGFHGTLPSFVLGIIRQINEAEAYVVSVDINSGLLSDSGLAECAVYSSLTVSIGDYKPGHFLNQAKEYIGELDQVSLGIEEGDTYAMVMETSDFCSIFPKRHQDSNKGNYGKAVIMGGSIEYSGAIKMANLSCAALRSGCGLATVVVPRSIESAVLPYLVESTLFSFPDENGVMICDGKVLHQALDQATCVALGMGWLHKLSHSCLLELILKECSIPIVIDAGGLGLLAEKKELLKTTKATVILTPHLKEFSRLTGLSIQELKADLVRYAKAFALEYRVILVLKGSTTIVTDGDTVYFSTSGGPGMAKGGSGDVLSGILVGILSFSTQSILLSVVAGVYIAGRANELAVCELNEYSVLARDTIYHVGEAITEILSFNQ